MSWNLTSWVREKTGRKSSLFRSRSEQPQPSTEPGSTRISQNVLMPQFQRRLFQSSSYWQQRRVAPGTAVRAARSSTAVVPWTRPRFEQQYTQRMPPIALPSRQRVSIGEQINASLQVLNEVFDVNFLNSVENIERDLQAMSGGDALEREAMIVFHNELVEERLDVEREAGLLETVVNHPDATQSELSRLAASGPLLVEKWQVLKSKYNFLNWYKTLVVLYYSTRRWYTVRPFDHFSAPPPRFTPKELQQIEELQMELSKYWHFRQSLFDEVMTDLKQVEAGLEDNPENFEMGPLLPRLEAEVRKISEHIATVEDLERMKSDIEALVTQNRALDAYLMAMQLMSDIIRTTCYIYTFVSKMFDINNIRKRYYIRDRLGYVATSNYADQQPSEIDETRLEDIPPNYDKYRPGKYWESKLQSTGMPATPMPEFDENGAQRLQQFYRQRNRTQFNA